MKSKKLSKKKSGSSKTVASVESGGTGKSGVRDDGNERSR